MSNDQNRERRDDNEGAHDDKIEPAGTIPNEQNGVGLTSDDEATSFEPEEDPEGASDEPAPDDDRQ